jgi:hypothetical protein
VIRAITLLGCAALALIAVEVVLRIDSTPVRIGRSCAAQPLFSGHGVDAATQRVVLDGLARAACTLGVTREALVLSFAASSGDRLTQPSARVERAVRTGLVAALDDATKRGEIPQLLAVVLRVTIEHAPIDRLISGKLL